MSSFYHRHCQTDLNDNGDDDKKPSPMQLLFKIFILVNKSASVDSDDSYTGKHDGE